MKSLPRLNIYIFGLLSILIFLCSLAGYLDQLHRYLELTNNFKLQYLLLSCCTLFFWLIIRQYSWLFLSAICVAINLSFIIPWYLPAQQQIQNIPYKSLRLLSFNVLHYHNERYDDAIQLVENSQTDIAVFQEAVTPWDKELLRLNQIFPYHVSAPKLQIEIYSKYPLKSTEVKLYGTYRGLVISQVLLNQSNFVLVAAHSYPQLYYGHEGWQIRNKQLEEGIGNQLGTINKPVIVAGDLNITMWSSQYKKMIFNSGLHNTRQGFGILPTQSSYFLDIPWLAIPLDHFLVSKDILVKNMTTGSNIGSDHLPIIVDVLIPYISP
ncbi:MAG: endonuclease/exonuclease/phosphatase family protein [Xenococcus sp. (in: cyanobacteria)]